MLALESKVCSSSALQPVGHHKTLLVAENRSATSESKEKSGGTALHCYS